MCIWSLIISVVSLAAYVALPSISPSAGVFVWATGVGVVVSLVSSILSLLGWRSEHRRWLRIVSTAVALGFVFTMGMMALNIVIYSWR